jgi:hypothetical protein
MKIIQIFARKTPRNRRNRPVHTLDLMTDWTARDWADLPVHHPRQD